MSSEAKSPESYVEKPKTFAELRAEISAGSTKAADLAGAYYDRIAQINPRLNVYQPDQGASTSAGGAG